MIDRTLTWTADSILEFLRQHREKLREFGVKKIGLFGSYARGEQHPNSDMDFLVELERLTFKDWVNTLLFLEESFGCSVDLVIEDSLREELRPYVIPEVMYVKGL